MGILKNFKKIKWVKQAASSDGAEALILVLPAQTDESRQSPLREKFSAEDMNFVYRMKLLAFLELKPLVYFYGGIDTAYLVWMGGLICVMGLYNNWRHLVDQTKC